MPNTQATPVADIQAIARRIVVDVSAIQSCDKWHDISEKLVSIQRSARSLLINEERTDQTCHGTGQSCSCTDVACHAPTRPGIGIAAGYAKEVERQLDSIACLFGGLNAADFLDPRTLTLTAMMMGLATDTIHKYARAAAEAKAEAEAEAFPPPPAKWVSFTPERDTSCRPLDVDGYPDEVA